MPGRTVLFILVLVVFAGNAAAIDEDFYIPYTDNYGYVYDPESGKFVKQEPDPQAAPAKSVEHANPSPVAAQAAANQSAEAAGRSNTGLPVFYIVIGGGLLLLAGITYWIKKRKKMTMNETDGKSPAL